MPGNSVRQIGRHHLFQPNQIDAPGAPFLRVRFGGPVQRNQLRERIGNLEARETLLTGVVAN